MTPDTIVANLARGRVRFADRTLLITEDGRTVSYAQFAELVENTALRLAADGIRPGDRIAICARNGWEIAVAIWACARGRFVFVGLPTNLDAPGWAALLQHTRPALLLAQREFLHQLPASARRLDGYVTDRRVAWREEIAMPRPGEVYALIYTSGTTGLPKAATLTHRATMHVATFYRDLLALGPTDVTAIHLPFSYVSGHISQLNPFLLAGGSAVTMPRFSAAELIRVIGEYGVSVLDVVPSIFALLLRHDGFTSGRLPWLRAAIFGGAPMPVQTVSALRDRMSNLALFNIYGMTETAGIIAALPDPEVDVHPGSVGRPVAGAQVQLGPDAELLIRGPMVTAGYWHNPAATALAVTDGWLHTGDTARRDGDGYLYLTGRISELINRGGVKIAPADVEAALLSHPGIAEAAAFGVGDGIAGQAVAACIVSAADTRLDVAEVKAWLRDRLPVHARPRILHVLDELPLGRTGKVDTAALRAVVQP